MNAAQLLVRCLESEGVEYVFGIPGEENLAIVDALLDSPIRFITTRHEQGAAFMADVYGRLTGRAGVCLSTLGPGATNLVTGVADANMDRAPLVAIAGQASTMRLHKESHQALNLINLFTPITKYAAQILEPETVNEIVRKAFKLAQIEKPGACFIDFPENIASAPVAAAPLRVQASSALRPTPSQVSNSARVIDEARFPIIMAGNGVIRGQGTQALVAFAERLNIPVATTFMAKGAIPASHPLSLGTVGLQAHDYVSCGFDRADVIICVGYDIVEYPPALWHRSADRKIVHIDQRPAEVDAHYIITAGALGDYAITLPAIAAEVTQAKPDRFAELREVIRQELATHRTDQGFPVKPQRIVADLREALDADDIVLCDVGAHKLWMARLYSAERPNTCIISNGFASMGIAVPGAVASALAMPGRKIVAVTGDGGFLMNSQEIETAVRLKLSLVILIWSDGSYGLIEWKQELQYQRSGNVRFANPDFVRYAESFGAQGRRIERAEDLLPTLRAALAAQTVTLIDCPVDYRENMRLTEQLGQMICPI
ncbi:MAG: acetolactate synthase large subunit [Gammaproteobacteria bacterium]|nr:acetolactate synthase large subunit [Gammaproteobacteria bacterium]